jgi:hypothetical protein
VGLVVGPVVDEDEGALQAMPRMIQPPLQQIPPPRAAKGSGVEHTDGETTGVVVAGGVVVVGAVGVVLDAGALQASPGGSQPPPQQVPPPIEANGSGVVQAADGGGVTSADAASVAVTSFDGPLVSPPNVYDSTAK